MSSDVVIEARELCKDFGSLRALDRVSFKVHRGEVVGFLGPNGAGKSTTMRILTCYLSATSGTARVGGHDVFEEPLAVRKALGYLPQRAPLYGDMSVWEYLRFVADVRMLDPVAFKKRMRNVAEICGLVGSLGKDIRNLSHGYRQRVGLAQALIHDPPILILDEPTSDLDPNEKAEVIRYIQEIGKERTVVLSTHNLAEVEAACARAIIVSKGRVVADGALEDVRARSGTVRYHVTIHEQQARGSAKAPTEDEVRDALAALPEVSKIADTPTDDRAHAFTLFAPKGSDLRPEIFDLVVQKGWLLLELRRDTKKLEDVFKSLTRGDELLERGRRVVGDEEEEPSDEEEAPDEEEEEEEEAAKAEQEEEEPEEEEENDEEEEEEEEEDEQDDDEADEGSKKSKK